MFGLASFHGISSFYFFNFSFVIHISFYDSLLIRVSAFIVVIHKLFSQTLLNKIIWMESIPQSRGVC